jgi:hypothetical protein
VVVSVSKTALLRDNIPRLQTLGTLHDFELDGLPFVQRPVPLHNNRRVMHEDFTTVTCYDEPVALLVVEPFDFTRVHD